MLQDTGAEAKQAIRGTCLICRWLENLEHLSLVSTGMLAAHWAVSVFPSDASQILEHFVECL